MRATRRLRQRTNALRPHSIILASCKPGLKPGFRPGLQPGFRQVRAGLRHAFDFFCRKHGRKPQQVRWFVRVLDTWNLKKNRFKQVRSWLSTCFRPGFRPGLQLARIMECGFYYLECRCNYSATSNNMKSVHWPLMSGLLYLVQRGGAWAGYGPAQSPLRCTKYNSPPINGQCTVDCCSLDVHLLLIIKYKLFLIY